MKKSSIILAKILTYGGTLPLIVCIIILYFPVAEFNSAIIANAYSAIIISFLCGIHWAAYLFFADKCPRNLFITSNIVALIAWGSLFIPNQPTAPLLQSLCFLYLLLLDLKLHDADIYPEWFYALRRNATIIVVICLTMLAGPS